MQKSDLQKSATFGYSGWVEKDVIAFTTVSLEFRLFEGQMEGIQPATLLPYMLDMLILVFLEQLET